MWLVKPGAKSRGRGIQVMTSFDKIIHHIKRTKGHAWVV